jgi:RimJ/RimL family protein N-acetyltransferase
MEIRKIELDDSKKFLNLCKKLDLETKNMLYEPDERITNVMEQKEKIKSIKNNGEIWVLDTGTDLVGYLGIMVSDLKRKKHCGCIAIGILNEFCSKGYGSKFFKTMIAWAKENRILRLELTVRTSNKNAIRLYEKFGFEIEGKSKKSMYVDSNYVDEYYMSNLIKEN